MNTMHNPYDCGANASKQPFRETEGATFIASLILANMVLQKSVEDSAVFQLKLSQDHILVVF